MVFYGLIKKALESHKTHMVLRATLPRFPYKPSHKPSKRFYVLSGILTPKYLLSCLRSLPRRMIYLPLYVLYIPLMHSIPLTYALYTLCTLCAMLCYPMYVQCMLCIRCIPMYHIYPLHYAIWC